MATVRTIITVCIIIVRRIDKTGWCPFIDFNANKQGLGRENEPIK